MNLLKWRKTVRDVRVEDPDGSSRLVKVTTGETRTVQHVEDGDRMHATGRLQGVALMMRPPVRQRRPLLLRNTGMPKMRQAFDNTGDSGLWHPVPPAPRRLHRP